MVFSKIEKFLRVKKMQDLVGGAWTEGMILAFIILMIYIHANFINFCVKNAMEMSFVIVKHV
jgi:hypothetical protein